MVKQLAKRIVTSMNEYEDVARKMVVHENELMNHRLNWLLTLEGLLFAGLGFAWGKDDTNHTKGLVFVFCLIGGGVPIFTWFILDAAQKALQRLREWWEKHRPEGYEGPEIVGYWHEKHYISWFTPWRVIPGAFVLAWVAVFCINWARPASKPVFDPNDDVILQKTPVLSPDELGEVRFDAAFDATYSPGTIRYSLYNPFRDKRIRGVVINVHAKGAAAGQGPAMDLFIDLACGPLQTVDNQRSFGPLVEVAKNAAVIDLKEVHYHQR